MSFPNKYGPYEDATKTLEYLFENGEVTAEEIKLWPLFAEYRNTEHYTSFVEKHQYEFSFSSYKPTEDDNACTADLIDNLPSSSSAQAKE